MIKYIVLICCLLVNSCYGFDPRIFSSDYVEKDMREREVDKVRIDYCNEICNFDTLKEDSELWFYYITEKTSQTKRCTKVCYNGKICEGDNKTKYEFCGKIEKYLIKTNQFDSLVVR